jgi:hypothetical protein
VIVYSFIQDIIAKPITQGILADWLEEKFRYHREMPRYVNLLKKTHKKLDIVCPIYLGTALDLLSKFGDKEDKKIVRRIMRKLKKHYGKGLLKVLRRKSMFLYDARFKEVFESERPILKEEEIA